MSIPVEFDTLKSMIQSLVAQARANEAGSNGGVVPNTYHPNTETYAIGCPPSDYETMFSKMGTVRDGTIVTVTNYGNLINMLVACGTGVLSNDFVRQFDVIDTKFYKTSDMLTLATNRRNLLRDMTANVTCRHYCYGTCTSNCFTACKGSCANVCTAVCAGNCSGGCSTTCNNACLTSCNNVCVGSCRNACMGHNN